MPETAKYRVVSVRLSAEEFVYLDQLRKAERRGLSSLMKVLLDLGLRARGQPGLDTAREFVGESAR